MSETPLIIPWMRPSATIMFWRVVTCQAQEIIVEVILHHLRIPSSLTSTESHSQACPVFAPRCCSHHCLSPWFCVVCSCHCWSSDCFSRLIMLISSSNVLPAFYYFGSVANIIHMSHSLLCSISPDSLASFCISLQRRPLHCQLSRACTHAVLVSDAHLFLTCWCFFTKLICKHPPQSEPGSASLPRMPFQVPPWHPLSDSTLLS